MIKNFNNPFPIYSVEWLHLQTFINTILIKEGFENFSSLSIEPYFTSNKNNLANVNAKNNIYFLGELTAFYYNQWDINSTEHFPTYPNRGLNISYFFGENQKSHFGQNNVLFGLLNTTDSEYQSICLDKEINFKTMLFNCVHIDSINKDIFPVEQIEFRGYIITLN